MYTKLVICFLLLESVGLFSMRTLGAYDFFESICDALKNSDNFQLDGNQQWKMICQEVYSSQEDDQDGRKEREDDEQQEEDGALEITSRKGGHGPGRGPGHGGHGNDKKPGGIRPGDRDRGNRTNGTTVASSVTETVTPPSIH